MLSLGFMILSAWTLYMFAGPVIEIVHDQYQHRSIAAYGTSMASAFCLARFAYYVREIRRKWWEYPAIEIGLGLGLATLAVKPDVNPLLNFMAFLASVRVTVDGIKRFREYRGEAVA
ncbi:hypothetical protein BJF93_11060 [Xaviernesmea oryzae]|uniref:Uncharacterized protein n=1 Tax=Xaviernesmea oryzae TaxID=464029 RepID=A0A1Q9AW27_9HYPH|nr:hypothetical protein BJF93_11060 [Xaviernesmea oryzae]